MSFQSVKKWLVQCLENKRSSDRFESDEFQAFWLKGEMRIQHLINKKVKSQVTVLHTTLADIIEFDNEHQNTTQTKLDDMFDAIADKLKSDGNFKLRFKEQKSFGFIPIA